MPEQSGTLSLKVGLMTPEHTSLPPSEITVLSAYAAVTGILNPGQHLCLPRKEKHTLCIPLARPGGRLCHAIPASQPLTQRPSHHRPRPLGRQAHMLRLQSGLVRKSQQWNP